MYIYIYIYMDIYIYIYMDIYIYIYISSSSSFVQIVLRYSIFARRGNN